jgi:predicted MFS family arabinose efflux permease
MNNDVLGGTPLTLGWIESMAGLGSLLAALLSGLVTSDRFNRAALIITELLLAVTIMALPFARSLIFAAFLYIGIGVFTGYWKILSKSLLLRSMDVSFSGRIMTAVSFFGLIVGVATALISGWLGTLHLSLGYGVGFVIALSCGIVTAGGFWTAPFSRVKHRFVELSMRIDS